MATGIDDEIYPNSPLVDVTCEVRFPGELQVECNRHAFWQKIRRDYPDIWVPPSKEGQAAALQHYRFRNREGTRIVSVALNSLAFSETKYSGHRKFIREFARIARLFHDTFREITRINRCGWRYVNIINFQRESGLIAIGRFLRIGLDFPKDVTLDLRNLQVRLEVERPGGLAIIGLGNGTRMDLPGADCLSLDLDFVITGESLRFKDCVSEITRARRHNRQLFEDLITDEYRQYLRGGEE